MSPTKKTAAAKSAPKKTAKASVSKSKKEEAKVELKAAELQVVEVDVEELEEAADEASYKASSKSTEAAGAELATTASTSEGASLSFKNFRHHPEMENFYRFIYENDLRYEALAVIDQILGEKRTLRKVAKEKGLAH